MAVVSPPFQQQLLTSTHIKSSLVSVRCYHCQYPEQNNRVAPLSFSPSLFSSAADCKLISLPVAGRQPILFLRIACMHRAYMVQVRVVLHILKPMSSFFCRKNEICYLFNKWSIWGCIKLHEFSMRIVLICTHRSVQKVTHCATLCASLDIGFCSIYSTVYVA